MQIHFPGGKRVRATYGDYVIETDQPEAVGGSDCAPSPFDLFLASIGTCAGYYVLTFCQKRDIPTDEIQLTMTMDHNEELHLIEKIDISVSLPESFPNRYVGACVKAAEQCTVKRHLQSPPSINLTASKR